MKRVLAYYLVLFYGIFLCKPLLPAAFDLVAHTCFEASHNETFHNDGGQSHVHLQMADASKEDKKDGSVTTISWSFDDVISEGYPVGLTAPVCLLKEHHFQSTQTRLPSPFLSCLALPPQRTTKA